MKECSFEGRWWIPDSPEKQCRGTLTFTPAEGANLNLIDSFADIKNLTEPLHYEVILGVTWDGKKVTLYDCFGSTSVSFPGFQKDSYLASMVFVGAHFKKAEDIKFKSLTINYSHLDEWANISGFDIQDSPKDSETTIKYKQPSPVEAITGDGYKIIISTRVKYPTHSIVQKEASIKQETYIRIEFPGQRSYTDCLDYMHHIQNFLTLSTMQPVYPLSIDGETESNVETIYGKSHHLPVSIHYEVPDTSPTFKSIHPFNMLLTLKQLDFKTLMKTWFEKKELLQSVHDMYFGTFYNPHMYLQHKFLSLVQALESYHRRVFRNYVWSEEKHKLRVEEILASVPEQYREWLSYKLKHSNEPSLPERLTELLDKYSEIAKFYIKDKDAFVQKVTDTRNYLTHYDTKRLDKAAEWPELYHISQRMKIILTACLLEQLGVALDGITATLIEKGRLFNVDSI